jgi:hypothetical protein
VFKELEFAQVAPLYSSVAPVVAPVGPAPPKLNAAVCIPAPPGSLLVEFKLPPVAQEATPVVLVPLKY